MQQEALCILIALSMLEDNNQVCNYLINPEIKMPQVANIILERCF